MTDSMEERRGDARILIISGLIFLCIVFGGALLCLYLFLPYSQSTRWYPIAGIILVGTPWAFWFLVYLYNCFKPAKPRLNGFSSSSKRAPPATSGATAAANAPEVESPVYDSPCGGQRRVHFGAVVVMGDQQVDRGQGERGGGEATDNNSHESHSKETRHNPMRSRESEVPLRSSISS